jgi:hypothetical protein
MDMEPAARVELLERMWLGAGSASWLSPGMEGWKQFAYDPDAAFTGFITADDDAGLCVAFLTIKVKVTILDGKLYRVKRRIPTRLVKHRLWGQKYCVANIMQRSTRKALGLKGFECIKLLVSLTNLHRNMFADS